MSNEYTEEQLLSMTSDELAEVVAKESSNNNKEIEPRPTEEEPESVNTDVTEESESNDESDDVEITPEDEPLPVENSYTIKADGKEYTFTVDELVKLAPKAMNYTRKMQDIAPYRKMITAISENEITQDDLNLLIDIKKGNKEALGALVQQSGVDPLDIEANESYRPTSYGIDENTYKLNQIVSRIENEPEFVQTQQVIQNLDDSSKTILRENPENIEGLHIDIKSGVFSKIYPKAEKLMVLDDYKKPFLDYYVQAGTELYQNEIAAKKVLDEQKALKEQETKNKKAQAGVPKSNQAKGAEKVIKYIEDIDEDDFKAWKKKVGLE